MVIHVVLNTMCSSVLYYIMSFALLCYMGFDVILCWYQNNIILKSIKAANQFWPIYPPIFHVSRKFLDNLFYWFILSPFAFLDKTQIGGYIYVINAMIFCLFTPMSSTHIAKEFFILSNHYHQGHHHQSPFPLKFTKIFRFRLRKYRIQKSRKRIIL